MFRSRTNMDIGLLLLRLALGAIFIVHGSQKALGLFGGTGPASIIQMTGAMGFRPPELWGWMLIIAEFGGGIGILLGLLTPLWALGLIITMAVAIWKVHGPNGFFLLPMEVAGPLPAGYVLKVGYEYNVALIGMALCLLFDGPGRISLDYLLFGRLRRDVVDVTPD